MALIHLGSLHTALASSRVMYHGTAVGRDLRILRGILSDGLVDPKNRCQKRETCVGVHVTENIKQAMDYADYAHDSFGGNRLLVVVRADVAAPQALPDSDMSHRALDFIDALGKAERHPPGLLIKSLTPTYKQLKQWGKGDVEAVAVALHQQAKQKARELVLGFLQRLQVKDYSKENFRLTYSHVYRALAGSYISAFSTEIYFRLENAAGKIYEKKLSSKETERALVELVQLYLHVLNTLAGEFPSVNKGVGVIARKKGDDLNNLRHKFDEAMLVPFVSDSDDLPPEVLRLFLISPKFTTTSDDSRIFTFAYNDTIGYSGRTRIIGVIEILSSSDLSLTGMNKLCNTGVDRSAEVSVPVVRVYHGTGSGFVRKAIETIPKHLCGDDDDDYGTSPICAVAGSRRGTSQLASTYSNGYLYGKVPIHQICKWAKWS